MSNFTLNLKNVKQDLFKNREEASTLPGEFYWKTEYYENEIEHIFRKKWICVGRGEDIPKTGDYKTEVIGDDSLIIIRNSNGGINAHKNVCYHCGCQLMSGRGKIKEIKCPYHGWLYSLDGELRSTPNFLNEENFNKREYSLYSVAVELWQGFIFINFDKHATSFRESISETEKFGVEKYDMGDMRTVYTWEHSVKCNWKAFIDNAMEFYHVPWVHPITFQANTPMNIWKEFPNITEQDWLLMVGQQPGASLSKSGDALLHVPETLSTLHPDFDGLPIWLANPTFVCALRPDSMSYYQVHPRGPEKTTVIISLCVYESDYIQYKNGDEETKKAIEEYIDNIDVFGIEDKNIAEQQQKGLRSNSFPGRFTKHEALIHKFAKYVFNNAYKPLMDKENEIIK